MCVEVSECVASGRGAMHYAEAPLLILTIHPHLSSGLKKGPQNHGTAQVLRQRWVSMETYFVSQLSGCI